MQIKLAYDNPELLYHLRFYLSIETPHTEMISVCGDVILITNKTADKKSSHNPYMQDYARFFVQLLIGS